MPTDRVDTQRPSQPKTSGRRVTKRRAQTRQRLLDAALVVFAEQGFGRSTVEEVCERAGYTRGAFYSNFVSLDELFLAIWEQRSAEQVAAARTAIERIKADGIGDLRGVVERVVEAVRWDDAWYCISAEFTAHALRHRALKVVLVAREQAILVVFMPLIEALLRGVGRAVEDPQALGQALIAVLDGTTTQCLLEPESAEVRQRQYDLFVRVLTAYTTDSRASASAVDQA